MRLLHVVVGHGVRQASSIADDIADASHGTVQVELVAGLGRALDHLRVHPVTVML